MVNTRIFIRINIHNLTFVINMLTGDLFRRESAHGVMKKQPYLFNADNETLYKELANVNNLLQVNNRNNKGDNDHVSQHDISPQARRMFKLHKDINNLLPFHRHNEHNKTNKDKGIDRG